MCMANRLSTYVYIYVPVVIEVNWPYITCHVLYAEINISNLHVLMCHATLHNL